MGTNTTRAAKRAKASEPALSMPPADPGASGQPPSITEAQALAALEARRLSVLEHAATVSTAAILGWLQDDLGLPDIQALRLHRQALKRRALQMLEDQVGARMGAAAGTSLSRGWRMGWLALAVLPGDARHSPAPLCLCSVTMLCFDWLVTSSGPPLARPAPSAGPSASGGLARCCRKPA